MTLEADAALIKANTPRFWQPRFWHGMRFSAWLRVLRRGGFKVSPSRIPLAISIGFVTAGNSFLGLVQELVFRKKIAATKVDEAPVFILGHWRSGTTLLHELMILDENYTYPTTFQCTAPTHFLLTWSAIKNLGFLLPKKRPMDDMTLSWEHPQEDEFALANLGMPSTFSGLAFPNETTPKYPITLEELSPDQRTRWQAQLKWFLRRISVGREKPVILKSPPHMARIPTLLNMFPNAKFVHIVRHPFNVYGSTLKLWKALQIANAMQVPDFAQLDEQVLSEYERMFAAFDRDKHLIPNGQYTEIKYEDLVADPQAHMEKIYQDLDLGDYAEVRAKIAAYFEDKKSYRVGSYSIAPEDAEILSNRWGQYTSQHAYNLAQND